MQNELGKKTRKSEIEEESITNVPTVESNCNQIGEQLNAPIAIYNEWLDLWEEINEED